MKHLSLYPLDLCEESISWLEKVFASTSLGSDFARNNKRNFFFSCEVTDLFTLCPPSKDVLMWKRV